ncbi:ferric reductase-like transmembrane domain-containing protein [Actinospica sp. MGRD01-02]|uniref:Ferric reductase-like transmembrane domain-containing protein n=1 Tax=Actinospica acidithermotolerans TaxID=2828514 RepID=A0A941E6P3_9ACTN|nr:ferric reductase-like transmembrane domain-containing protein [Actinospica acidithermotolerans]MBR7827345.1 ferric reductase-like transmembrane domain-containing protein [Actinospica acidithermotolerans]
MNSTALWYLSQGTGVVSLVLYTAVMLLGIAVVGRGRLPGLPRFGVVALHRSISLLSLVFLALHIGTAILDGYVDISVLSAFVPFASAYEPLLIGLGAVAVDLTIALIVTSLLRDRIGPRLWRAVHWLAYAFWPIAIAHSIGLGSGRGELMNGWQLWLTIACVLAVLGALAWRISVERARSRRTPAQVLHTTRSQVRA